MSPFEIRSVRVLKAMTKVLPAHTSAGHINVSAYQDQACREPVRRLDLPGVVSRMSNLNYSRGVVLPVAALLKQYKDHPDSVMIRHFDLLFIQQSIGKLPSQVWRQKNGRKNFLLILRSGATRFAACTISWTG